MLQQGKFFDPTFSVLYKYFAVYVQIQGMYNVPAQCRQNRRPLRTDIEEAHQHFATIYPDDLPPNTKTLEKLFPYILITHEFFDRMSTRFQGLLRNLGSTVSGDEKLFKFTGNSCYIKLVSSKPTRIGLWMYQLVAQLSNGLSILIHMSMLAHESVRGERAPVHNVVRAWRDVILKI